ncbi:DUF6382 domain-containing protein [Paenibacillus xerothermodurans]|uniref:FHA domain-containing protein n=1 Tax=Paenibacillus xerothermodurans TaxID=1977292 RepID=A0A2W1NSQ7_PAEXE|nr:DUF6382 domain-containing protein [Paenibacillus xerothermodurans]PZE21813.1 FHA domain-containing protein [Paenibacillus xerothermodurans]
MNAHVYGLDIDFVTRNGHFMVVTSPSGMHRSELSAFQVNMMVSNKIPHLLELQVEEWDQNMKLYYNITGKRMLTHWMRFNHFTIKQFFSFMYQIVDIVAASNVYMLQESRYILQEDYIYCTEDGSDLQLTYIPMEVLPEKKPLPAELQELASRLVHKVTELTGNGYQELMNYLMDDSFNLPVLKQLLLKHMTQLAAGNYSAGIHPSHTESGRITGRARQPQMADEGVNGSHSKRIDNFIVPQNLNTTGAQFLSVAPAPAGAMAARPPDHTPYTPTDTSTVARGLHAKPYATAPEDAPAAPKAEAQPFAPPAAGYAQLKPGAIDEPMADEPADSVDQHQKLKLPVLLMGVLALCLIWKLYLDQSGEPWLLICSGLTVLVVNLAFIVLWIWKPPMPEEDDQAFWQAFGGGHSEPDTLGHRNQRADVVPFFTPAQPKQAAVPSAAAVLDRHGRDLSHSRLDSKLSERAASVFEAAPAYYRSLEQRTTVLTPPDSTVLLSQAAAKNEAGALPPYLQWTTAGELQKCEITKASFVIGRAGQNVDLQHNVEGVSRIHAEIVKEDNIVHIKDLGSRNGTDLNEEALVPYRIYPLQAGDIIRIANTEFIFKTGKVTPHKADKEAPGDRTHSPVVSP